MPENSSKSKKNLLKKLKSINMINEKYIRNENIKIEQDVAEIITKYVEEK